MPTHAAASQSAWNMVHRGKRVGVCHGGCGSAAGGLRGGAIARVGEAVCGRRPDPAAVGAGGDLRRRLARRGGQDRRRRIADGARLGAGVQCRGPAGADQRQGARQGAAARCRQAPGLGAGCRGGPYPGGARGGALAAHRSGAVGVRPLRDFDQQADLEPRIARPWLSQTVGPAAPSCPGRRGRRCL